MAVRGRPEPRSRVDVGPAGESHMAARAEEAWVTMFTYGQDDVEPFASIADFESWLPEASAPKAASLISLQVVEIRPDSQG